MWKVEFNFCTFHFLPTWYVRLEKEKGEENESANSNKTAISLCIIAYTSLFTFFTFICYTSYPEMVPFSQFWFYAEKHKWVIIFRVGDMRVYMRNK